MARGLRAALVLGAAAFWSGAPAAAAGAGDGLEACLEGADDGQRLRDQGKYRQARGAFLACARDACPGPVRSKCLTWLQQVEDATPTLVVVVRDSNGNDLNQASVAIDGERVLERLDGKPLAVDPGNHRIEIDVGGRVRSRNVLLVAAEKNRVIAFELPATAADPESRPVPARDGPAAIDPGSTPWLAIALTGVGLLGIGSFAYFGLTARSDLNALQDAPCAKTRTCSQSEVDSVRTRYLVADLSFGVGVVSLGIATWLFATHESSPGPRVGASFGPSVAALSLDTRF
jgi:hypothetical protein